MPMPRQTHTYAELELSQAAYDEIARKLRDAGYDHSFMHSEDVNGAPTIDMHGIGITRASDGEGDDADIRKVCEAAGAVLPEVKQERQRCADIARLPSAVHGNRCCDKRAETIAAVIEKDVPRGVAAGRAD